MKGTGFLAGLKLTAIALALFSFIAASESMSWAATDLSITPYEVDITGDGYVLHVENTGEHPSSVWLGAFMAIFGDPVGVEAGTTNGYALRGIEMGSGYGVYGQSVSGVAVYGVSTSGSAGLFDGNVTVNGDVGVTGKISFPDGSVQESAGGNTSSVSVISTSSTLTSANRGVVIVSGNTTLTLPGPDPSNQGWLYTIKKSDAGTRVRILGTIDGSSNWSIHEQYGSLTIVSDGSSWLLVSIDRANRGNILYNAGLHSGDLGGRIGADMLCGADGNKPAGFTARAFLSTAANDSIAGMPGKYAIPTDAVITSLSGKIIATSWNNLMSTTLLLNLLQANVVDDMSQSMWWSGSDSAGFYADSCGGFQSESVDLDGMTGSTLYQNNLWISYYVISACTDFNLLLCIAY